MLKFYEMFFSLLIANTPKTTNQQKQTELKPNSNDEILSAPVVANGDQTSSTSTVEPVVNNDTIIKITPVVNGDETPSVAVANSDNILKVDKNETIHNNASDDDVQSKTQTEEKIDQVTGIQKNSNKITNDTTNETAENDITNSMNSLCMSIENESNTVVNGNDTACVNKENDIVVSEVSPIVNDNDVSPLFAPNGENTDEKQSERNSPNIETQSSIVAPCDTKQEKVLGENNDHIEHSKTHNSIHNGFENHEEVNYREEEKYREEDISMNDDDQTCHKARTPDELPSVDTTLSSSVVLDSEDPVKNKDVLTELSGHSLSRENENESVLDFNKSVNDTKIKNLDERKAITSDEVFNAKTENAVLVKDNPNEGRSTLNGLQSAGFETLSTTKQQEPLTEPVKTSSHRFSRQFSSSDSEGEYGGTSFQQKTNKNRNSLSLSLDRELNSVGYGPHEVHSPKGTTGDRNVVHVVKLSSRHTRQGSNVSVASLTERCREIQGEAVEHHTPVKAALKEAGGDDTLEANMQPSNEPLTVEHQQQHDESEDEDGKLYPASPFPPPQQSNPSTTAHQSIYSQRSLSLSEFSLEQTQELLGDEDERLLEDMMEYDRIDVQNDLIESIDSITDVEDNDSPVDIITEPGAKGEKYF